MMAGIHLDLDSAWPSGDLPMPTLDARNWGPRLRYCAPARIVESFFDQVHTQLADFVLYGSGDFHYLAALWLRRIRETATVVSFDNHPDWDVRPPRWGCGGWVNRALELRQVERVCVWGCGNFELAWPSRLFANHCALKSGKLEVHAWAERQQPPTQRRFDCMRRENWRGRFARWAESLAGKAAYVTIDLDCLSEDQAVTNWESGLFTADDLLWALDHLRSRARIVGGDMCGACSPPIYSRWTQRFVGKWDHPKTPPVDLVVAQHTNQIALSRLWPKLTG
jgi:hypothetical protein